MFYRLSNTAQREDIEKEFDVKFEFPKLYKPATVINGLEESTLSIITMDNPQKVSYAIWGLLPQTLEENWDVFQKLTNTLNINFEGLNFDDNLYSDALDNRRCLIITTGFFTSALHHGKMYPFHVYLKNHRPFCIAGVYNRLSDGFLTCSILIKKTTNELDEIPNLLSYKPVIFDEENSHFWLNRKFNFDSLRELIVSHQKLRYESHPVSKEFYNNDKFFDKIIKSEAFDDFID
ncbi:SOS response-associated peptidase [Subsaxibacter sp. CAU 1640]|uniref:SOS response-associated peptidase family protein n=1 Tax=Subsaxibacter sp. CAU 1640 TaxID=2933271 RepID=UPI0020047D93|nr:SOS response-associated peptidase family protein [Subsaxibacter sp. CAU 1640]MCK7591807.1 SOS response-associated peptidase [Subsaxibacter sp. CAU 1640]